MSILERLLQIKDIETLRSEAADGQKNSLKRTLTVKDLVGIGIGGVIGSGIFVTAGLAAAGNGVSSPAGPAVMLSFVIVAFVCLFCVLCYAEFASIIPVAGSAYTYAYAVFGEYAAWFLGWNLILEYAMANVAVAISWSGYFASVCEGIGIHIPDYLLTSYFSASPEVIASAPHILGIPIVFNFFAPIINIFIALLLIRGIRQSSDVNNILVFLKIGIILFLICVGACYIHPENWRPFNPGGFAGVQAGAAMVFFAYIGFDAITTVAEETKNPGRDLPLGMIITLAVSTVLYVSVAAVMTGMVPYTELSNSSPMAKAFELAGAPWAAMIISVGALIAITAVLFVFQTAQPRVFFVMSRDGLLPKVFSRVHEKFGTPHIATLFNLFFVTLGCGFMDLSVMIELCNIGTLAAFMFVCIGIIVLRKKRPELARPFKTPLVPWVPIGGILSCLYLLGGITASNWITYSIWVAAGTLFYLFYGIKHSTLAAENSEKKL